MPRKTTTGKVVNTQDPAYAGRITVALAEVDGKEYPEWIDPVWMGGWLWLPEPGDTVELEIPDDEDLVEFADEVRWRGIINDQDNVPPNEFKENYPKRRGFKTKAGHILILDDKDKFISLKTPANHTLLLSEKDDKVSLRYKDSILITINGSGIFFGSETADQPFVLGTRWKSMMDTVLQAIADHTHPTGVGPSGKPVNETTFITEKDKTELALSDIIFGEKG